jgi:hypothetical protein
MMSSAARGSGRQRRAALMQGSSDNREYELAVVREAIAAKTDPALGADLPNAAEHLLRVLDDCEFRDERGKLRSRGVLTHSTDLGLFFYFVWRRIMRYGFDATQRSEARRWTFYLPAATGATGTDEPWSPAHHDLIPTRVKRHLLSIVDCDVERREGLVRNDTMNARVMLLEVKCTTSNLVSRGHWPVAKTKMHLKDPSLLRRCGLPSPRSFHLELEREWATDRREADPGEPDRSGG